MVDELSLGLAPMLGERIMAALVELRDGGMALLMVDQDVELALETADRGYVLDSGHITMAGAAADLRNDPRIREAYLGIC